MSSAQIREYVQFVVESLVDEPDAVKVTDSFEDGELFIDVEVADGERGRVIGRQGRLIRSLRVVVRAAAGRDNMRATVELLEPEEGDDDAPASAAGDDATSTGDRATSTGDDDDVAADSSAG